MKFIKLFLMFLVLALAVSLLGLWYKTYVVGMYYASASIFMTLLGGVAPVLIIYGAFKLCSLINKSDISL